MMVSGEPHLSGEAHKQLALQLWILEGALLQETRRRSCWHPSPGHSPDHPLQLQVQVSRVLASPRPTEASPGRILIQAVCTTLTKYEFKSQWQQVTSVLVWEVLPATSLWSKRVQARTPPWHGECQQHRAEVPSSQGCRGAMQQQTHCLLGLLKGLMGLEFIFDLV